MTQVHIITGLSHGQQWLCPGVHVSVPDDTARAWVQAGLASAPDQESTQSAAEDTKAVRQPRAKKAA